MRMYCGFRKSHLLAFGLALVLAALVLGISCASADVWDNKGYHVTEEVMSGTYGGLTYYVAGYTHDYTIDNPLDAAFSFGQSNLDGEREFYYKLTITGNGPMPQDCSDAPWHNSLQYHFIDIGKGVTTIGDYAFGDMKNDAVQVEEIRIPDTVTSIGRYAFSRCMGPKTIHIPSSVTFIGEYAFAQCKGLESMTIPGSVKTISRYAFKEAYHLKELVLEEGIEEIGEFAFADGAFTTVKIPASVRTIRAAAFPDTLEKLEIPKTVTSLEAQFVGYSMKRRDIVIPEDHPVFEIRDGCIINKADKTLIQYLKTLTSYTIPEDVKAIGPYAFTNSRLKSVVIPEGVTRIGHHAFANATGLASVQMPDSVTEIEAYAFEWTKVENMRLPKGLTTIRSNALQSVVYSTLVIPDSVTVIEDYGLACVWADSVVLPKGIQSIGAGAFAGGGIANVRWPAHITTIRDKMFEMNATMSMNKGQAPREFVIPDGVTTIGKAIFLNASQWNTSYSIYIPSSVVSIPDSLFSEGYENITTIDLAVYCEEGSYAEEWADKCGYAVTYVGKDAFAQGTGAHWEETDNGWVYYDDMGKAVRDWMWIDGEHYYFSNYGQACDPVCAVGWRVLRPENEGNRTLYYFTESGALDASKSQELDSSFSLPALYTMADGRMLYFESYGKPETGLFEKKIGDEFKYFIADETGVIQTGWITWNGGTYYAFGDGNLARGTQTIGGVTYEFDLAYGRLLEGTAPIAGSSGWVLSGSDWMYYDDAGNPVVGWQQIDGTWYYFTASGAMVTGWQQIDGTWYYFTASGAMVTGWQQIGDTWYYFTAGGAMKTGWLQDGAVWYWFDASGAMATGTRMIDGVQYNFDASGVWIVSVQSGWVQENGSWVYYDASGTKVTGWLQDGAWYYFNDSGIMATGWKAIGGTWYYFKSSGAMVTGWQQIGGNWYYFRESGAMVTGWYEDKDVYGNTIAWYWFDEGGVMATGWKEIGGQWEMFSDSGAWLYTWQAN